MEWPRGGWVVGCKEKIMRGFGFCFCFGFGLDVGWTRGDLRLMALE